MQKIEKQVLQSKSFFVAKDGKEYDTYEKCAEHEYDLAVNDAKKFNFKWEDECEESFTVVYHSNMQQAFAEDLSIILNYRFDLTNTCVYQNYKTRNILDKFKKNLGCEFIYEHEYLFECDYQYNDDCYDSFYLSITDITERDRVKNAVPECKEAIFENSTTHDFIELAKHQVNAFGSETVKIVLNELINTICNE